MMLARSLRRSPSDRAVIPVLRPRQDIGRVIRLRARALQHEAVEGREFVQVEAQGRRAAGQRIGQFGAGPVDHRHEIVADRRDAALREVAHGLAVIVEQGLEVAFADLDAFMDRQALDDAPAQAERSVGGDERFALLDLLHAPDHAIRDLMQGRHDARRAGLADMGELDDIVRTEPAPSLFHGIALSLEAERGRRRGVEFCWHHALSTSGRASASGSKRSGYCAASSGSERRISLRC